MKKVASNTTTKNLTKKSKLSTTHILPRHLLTSNTTGAFLESLLRLPQEKEAILYNLGKALLGNTTNKHAQDFISEYEYPYVDLGEVPYEFDILGAAYQYLNTKYENLTMGSFYTGKDLASQMTEDMTFEADQTLVDLSCGSGTFLFSSNAPYDRIFGVDFDPIAVMIAKFNFFIKFPDSPIYPQIYQDDFLDWYSKNSHQRFTYVVGNPPYGADLHLGKVESKYVKTGESFSYFIEFGYNLLEEGGRLSYLLPEAFLNVKRHQDIRDFVLNETHLTQIIKHKTRFTGVMTDIYQVDITNVKNDSNHMRFVIDGRENTVPSSSFKELKNHIFAPISPSDVSVIKKVKEASTVSLKGSRFALGVVTGDNASKLLNTANEETEHIFTGKEIGDDYNFLPAKKHIVFDRTQLQQVAPDDVYRAPEKLVYKVISKSLKVVVDTSKSLTSSSANIIIPNVEGNTVYSVALLLNSNLYRFYNQKVHGGVNKVSRDNLEALPLPEFNEVQQTTIYELVKMRMAHEVEDETLQEFVYDYFNISLSERQHIESELK